MRLDITEGKGGVTVFTMSDPGNPANKPVSLVVDPKNETRPTVELKEWLESTGGSVPLGVPDGSGGVAGAGPAGGAAE